MSKMAIIFWSMSGNTQAMAYGIEEGAKSGGAEVKTCSVSEITPAEALEYDLLALGCPAMGSEKLEEAEFEPFFQELLPNLGGKKVALFGSYGWGDGEWMREWQARTTNVGAQLFRGEGLIINDRPDDAAMEQCENFGREFANF